MVNAFDCTAKMYSIDAKGKVVRNELWGLLNELNYSNYKVEVRNTISNVPLRILMCPLW
jgi:hypothetical protein